jgi:endoglucanase
MDRRSFLKTSGTIAIASSITGLNLPNFGKPAKQTIKIPRYKGFNITNKTGGFGPRTKFNEQDFEILADWGLNFARIPMSYWNWASKDDWFNINEDVLKDIDEVVEFGKQYNVHINLGFHRAPGYCINGRNLEPMDLFNDTPERMQQALNATVYHWKIFARRYKGIPSTRLSFDLINEPPKMKDETRYVEIVKALVEGIHDEDPGRLIIADGKNIGRNPLMGAADLGIAQSTRGYDPMAVSHYTAAWVPDDEKETFNPPTWPLKADNGKIWDKEALREKLITSWKPLTDLGVPVHVGEWGCFNKTPHDICIRWMEDILSLWKEVGWGHAMWNLKGTFGVLNSDRPDVKYEDYKGFKLDRKMLELLKQY